MEGPNQNCFNGREWGYFFIKHLIHCRPKLFSLVKSQEDYFKRNCGAASTLIHMSLQFHCTYAKSILGTF